MKQLLLLSVLILTVSKSQAQITLTAAKNTPQLGQTFNYYSESGHNFNIFYESGPNQVWDLSNVGGNVIPVNILSPSNTVGGTEFANADFALSYDGSIEVFYAASSTELAEMGSHTVDDATVKNTDNRVLSKFPLSYGDVFSETFSGVVYTTIGLSYNRSGTTNIYADGYGDLKLPYGTISNVLKVLVVNSYSDEYLGQTLYSYEDTAVYFYNDNTKLYVANVGNLYINGFSFTDQNVLYLSQTDVVGIEYASLENSPYAIFPNPAKDKITFSNPDQKEVSMSILNALGSTVYTEDTHTSSDIDISEWTPGLYILRCKDERHTYVEKVMIK